MEPLDLARYAAPVLVLVAIAALGVWLLFGNDGGDGNQGAAMTPTTSGTTVASPTANGQGVGRATQRPGDGGAVAGVTATSTGTTGGSGQGSAATETPDEGNGGIVDPFDEPVIDVSSRDGQTLADIAREWGLNVRTLVWANQDIGDPTAVLEPGTDVAIPPVDGVVHTVSSGETLETIAEAYGVSVWDITSVIQNGVSEGSALTPGQVLTVHAASLYARSALAYYTVAPSDDLGLIASYYGLQPATIAFANGLPDAYTISGGQVLVIPPADGILVYAGEGDTVELIARIYGVDPERIRSLAFNAVPGVEQPVAGQPIMVPGLELLTQTSGKGGTDDPAADPFVVSNEDDGPAQATGTFMWPAIGNISQEFGSGHSGLDIANVEWTPVMAADGGVVTFAGWNDFGLGYAVAIDHENGYVTWYGHLAESPAVAVGERVSQGDWLGPMGSTGRSTGPHLHFVVLLDDVFQDPLAYLP